MGFGGYWAYDRYVKADHTSAAAEAPANPDSAPAVNPPAPQVPSAAPAPVPAPVVPASPPAYTGGGDEQTYLSLLRNRSDMTITDPARLLELGKEVCVYLGTQSGPTTVVMGNVKDLLGREGTSGTEWVHITAAAVTTLCPEHKSKILP